MFNNKTIFITGGTGSFGKAFAKKILQNYKPKKLIIFSRDELKQFEMQNHKDFKKFGSDNKNIIRYFIGDIRDRERLSIALQNDVDFVIHAAALKQVPTAEYNPFEVIKTNVVGAQNLIEICLENKVKKIIALSTDKAAAPVNLYGATKLASDKLFIAANNYVGQKNTKFSVVRYGNVLGSRGSVIPYFLEKKKDGKIPITNKKMTRFSITLNEGVDFVIKSLQLMKGAEIFVPKIPSYKIMDLAKAIAPRAKFVVTGTRPGEKIHEQMITLSDSLNTIEFNDFYIIFSNSDYFKINKNYYLNKKKLSFKSCKENFDYTSNKNKFLSVSEIKKLINKNLDVDVDRN